ncbi:MAG: hypothetical protein GY749_25535 [Desulfobacteraceae bacterium]|nr:hypothetical protein [Desulfobacteraceae bacterium]
MRRLSARDCISRVAERWFLAEPLLFSVWMTHHPVADPRIRTIRVRRGLIEYNPDFIIALDKRQLDIVLQCEAVRIILKHPYSRRKENREIAYLASNVTIQEYLRTELPFPSARDLFGTNEFDRQYFEFYYNKLYTMADHVSGGLGKGKHGTPGSLNGQTEDGEGQGDGDGGEGRGDGDDTGESADKKTGSGDDSPKTDSLTGVYADAEASGRENTQDWDRDELFSDQINDKIRIANETNQWGTIPGILRERILASLRPKLDYRAVLRLFRASVLSVNRVLTRMKPSRRYGFLYMGSRRDFTTRLLFAVDVSGSVGSDDLARGFSVINQFFKYGIQSVDVIQFDTEIKGKLMSMKRARRKVAALGRGGTDFRPVIEYIDEHPEYDGLVIFTDGYAPVPPKPKNRKTRILWLFNSESNYHDLHDSLRHIGHAAFLKED